MATPKPEEQIITASSVARKDITPSSAPSSQPLGTQQVIAQQQNASDQRLASLQQYLQQSANEQIKQQQGLLGQARDQQLSDLQKALNNAVNQGELSVREAQQQYENARTQIFDQAYTDSQQVSVLAQNRGIGNSQQLLGLEQGNVARRDQLLNQNLTVRDNQINSINNSLAQIKNNYNIDTAQANANYNYGLANATAGINSQLYGQLGQYQFQSGENLAQFEQNLIGQDRDQAFAVQQAEQAQRYALEQLSVQQRYQLETLAKQQGYDLQKLSIQQQYSLALQAKQYGYDFNLQKSAQQFQAQQNTLDRNFQSSQAALDRNFQVKQNQADRNLQVQLQNSRNAQEFAVLDKQFAQQAKALDNEISRKLALYTPGTTAYKAVQAEADFAFKQLQRENLANQAAEVGHTKLANILAQYPTTLPNPNDKRAVEKYDSTVKSLNKQVTALLGADGQKYLRDLSDGYKKKTGNTSIFSGANTAFDVIRNIFK